MSKVKVTSNHRVEIPIDNFIRGYGRRTLDDNEIQNKANIIIAQIKRHIDIDNSPIYLYDVDFICSYCGYVWDVDEDGCPYCCDRAMYEWELCNRGNT